MKTAKAAVMTGAGQPFAIKEYPLTPPPAGMAQLELIASGICGTDLHIHRGKIPVHTPAIIGHEFVGRVSALSEEDSRTYGIRPGDRVIVDPYLYCGRCYPCSIGRTNCCTDLKVLGVHVDGGMVETFAHPAEMLVKVPDSIPWELIPLAEPLTIALHGLHRARLAAGEWIAISGAGPVGLLAAMTALVYGAHPILIDPVAERLQKARELGVRHTVHLGSEDAVETVRSLTGGVMAQVVMEASGANAAILSAFDLACNAGRIILTGWPKKATPLQTEVITRKELDVRGARTSAGEFEEALDLIASGKVNVRGILTRVVPAQELAQAVRDVEQHPGDYLKVVGRFQ